jgi:hypothetical protein
MKTLVKTLLLALCIVAQTIVACAPVTEPAPVEDAEWTLWDSSSPYKGRVVKAETIGDTIAIDIAAVHHNGCTPGTKFTFTQEGNVFTVKAYFLNSQADAICTQALTPFTLGVRLPAPAPGSYRVRFIPSPLETPFDSTFTVR